MPSMILFLYNFGQEESGQFKKIAKIVKIVINYYALPRPNRRKGG